MEVIEKLIWGLSLSEFEKKVILRIAVATIVGGLIGMERELKGRPAGMKTFSLVCIGAAMVMITNEYIINTVSDGNGDIGRLAAQVISGIGFLGAGTIIVTGNNQIRGLTTAAALWVTAAMGIMIGTGFFFGSIVGIIFVYSSSFLFREIECFILEYSRCMKIHAEGENEAFTMELLEYFESNDIHIKNFSRMTENKWYSEDVCLVIEFKLNRHQKHREILKGIRNVEGIRFVEEL